MGEAAMKTTVVMLKALRDKFTEAKSGDWLTRQQLGFRNTRSLEANSSTLMRRLVEHRVLEQADVERADKRKEYKYRVTSGGWHVLEHLGDFAPATLQEKFGKPFETKPNDCETCGKTIRNRKSNSTTCWACAPTANRIKSKRDWVPRSPEYMALLTQGRQVTERARISAARRAHGQAVVVKPPGKQQELPMANIDPLPRIERVEAGKQKATEPTWSPRNALKGIYDRLDGMAREIAGLKHDLAESRLANARQNHAPTNKEATPGNGVSHESLAEMIGKAVLAGNLR